MSEIKYTTDGKKVVVIGDLNQDEEWKPYSSHVLGELKHRSMALKRRITKIQNIATRELWRI